MDPSNPTSFANLSTALSTSTQPPPTVKQLTDPSSHEKDTGLNAEEDGWEYQLAGTPAPRSQEVSVNLNEDNIIPNRTRNRKQAHAAALTSLDSLSDHHAAFATDHIATLDQLHRDKLPEELHTKTRMDPSNPTSFSSLSTALPTSTQPPPTVKQPTDPSSHEKDTGSNASDSTLSHTQPNNNPLPEAHEVIKTNEDLLNAWKVVNWAFDIQNTPLPNTGKPSKHAFVSTCSLQHLALYVLFVKSEAMFDQTSGRARLAWGTVVAVVYPRLLWITQQPALKQQIANYREPFILTMTDAICSDDSEDMDREERIAGITKDMFSLSRLQTAQACWRLLKYGAEVVHHPQGLIAKPKQIDWRIRQIEERIERFIKP